MIIENLPILKIHKMTEAQFKREKEAGRTEESALYLTPDEDIDLSVYATKDDVKNIDFPVDSVNGKTGVVTLSASDIGALSSDANIDGGTW